MIVGITNCIKVLQTRRNKWRKCFFENNSNPKETSSANYRIWHRITFTFQVRYMYICILTKKSRETWIVKTTETGIRRNKSRVEFHEVTTWGFVWLITLVTWYLYLPIAIWERKGFFQFKFLTTKLDIPDEFTDGEMNSIAFEFQATLRSCRGDEI